MSNPEDNDDIAFFRQAMQDVKPLSQDTVAPYRPKLKAIPKQRQLDDEQVKIDMLSDWGDSVEWETGVEMEYQRAGVQHRVMAKLRRGAYSIQAELDLHGMRVPEARAALSSFFSDCREQAWHCIRLIHGKGRGSPDQQPVLKRKLNHWLRDHDAVLAFCAARPFDGGSGALYVLLKRRNPYH